MPDENLEVTDDGYWNAHPPLHADGPDLPTFPSPRTPNSIPTDRK
jgi:hypothetical protein